MPSLTDCRTDQPQPESSTPQRLSQPEGVDWPDNDQERTLADFFLELVHSGPPTPLPRPSPPSVDRVWAPQSLGGPPPDDGRFTARHPEFTFGGIDCPTRAIGRAPRNSMRGRQGRFHSRKMKRTLRARSDLEGQSVHLVDDHDIDARVVDLDALESVINSPKTGRNWSRAAFGPSRAFTRAFRPCRSMRTRKAFTDGVETRSSVSH